MLSKHSLTRQQLESYLGIPFTHGNKIVRLKNGDQIFPAMLQAMEKATTRIDFATFVYWKGDIAFKCADVLCQKAAEGITVNVLLDAIGAKPMPAEVLRMLEQANIELRWVRPVLSHRFWLLNKRTHRKALIIDGQLGFTGGVGIAEQWQGNAQSPDHWRETHFQIEGPAVSGIAGAFFSNWVEAGTLPSTSLDIVSDEALFEQVPGSATVQVLRSTTSAGWSDVATLLNVLLNQAEKSIRIATAYFVPDKQIRNQLIAKALSGVEIDVLMPGQHTDQRLSQLAGEDSFNELLKAGIRLWRYEPTMLHTKILLIDDYISAIGSPNLNQRSMKKDDELILTVLDSSLNKTLADDFAADLERSTLLTKEIWLKRSVTQKISETLSRIVRHEM